MEKDPYNSIIRKMKKDGMFERILYSEEGVPEDRNRIKDRDR